MHTEVLLRHTVAFTADMGKVVQPAVSAGKTHGSVWGFTDTVKSEREMTIKLSTVFHLPNEHLTELILYCCIMFLKSSMRKQTPRTQVASLVPLFYLCAAYAENFH